MRKEIGLMAAAIFVGIAAHSQNPFALDKIPDALKKNAIVITHIEDFDYDVEDIDRATLKVHHVYTVMNEEGKADLFFSEYTSRDVSLDDAEMRVFDATGKQIKRYKKKDMVTRAAGEGLIPDGNQTFCYAETNAYPVTIDLTYEMKFKGTLNCPDFRFINAREAVIQSSYTAHVPENVGLRYKSRNMTLEPEVRVDGNKKVYRWTVQNVAPIDYEEGTVSPRNKYPQVSMVPNRFSYYGFEGDFTSWQTFGKWIMNLYTGLDELTPARQEFFKSLVKGATDDRERIRRIYRYMQDNFRYVSIQLGIGGLRPFSAEFTDAKKYGDCKGLSNFMKAALKSVGIKSYVAIINAEYNEEPVDPDFPSNDFNHVIVCVPGQQDSTWLECTSSTAEFGKLGSFTENRNALLITENGGALVPTPKSISSTNILRTVTRVNVEDDLSAISETSIQTTGAYDEVMNEILKDNKDDQKGAIVYYLGFRQPDEFELRKSENLSTTVLRMAIAKVPEFNAGNKFFVSPRLNKIWAKRLPKAEGRKFDYYFNFPFEKYDTTIYKLPVGMKPDGMTKDVTKSCPYGSYQSKAWYSESEHAVYSTASLVLRQYKVLAADYPAVKKFFEEVAQDDAQRIVIVGNASSEKKAF